MSQDIGRVALQQVGPLMGRYGGPVGVLGKAIGLGPDEIEAGAPWWAWLGVGAVVGGVLTYAARGHLERIFKG